MSKLFGSRKSPRPGAESIPSSSNTFATRIPPLISSSRDFEQAIEFVHDTAVLRQRERMNRSRGGSSRSGNTSLLVPPNDWLTRLANDRDSVATLLGNCAELQEVCQQQQHIRSARQKLEKVVNELRTAEGLIATSPAYHNIPDNMPTDELNEWRQGNFAESAATMLDRGAVERLDSLANWVQGLCASYTQDRRDKMAAAMTSSKQITGIWDQEDPLCVAPQQTVRHAQWCLKLHLRIHRAPTQTQSQAIRRPQQVRNHAHKEPVTKSQRVPKTGPHLTCRLDRSRPNRS
jgi:hypothetical protein